MTSPCSSSFLTSRYHCSFLLTLPLVNSSFPVTLIPLPSPPYSSPLLHHSPIHTHTNTHLPSFITPGYSEGSESAEPALCLRHSSQQNDSNAGLSAVRNYHRALEGFLPLYVLVFDLSPTYVPMVSQGTYVCMYIRAFWSVGEVFNGPLILICSPIFQSTFTLLCSFYHLTHLSAVR